MPVKHREFLEYLESISCVRQFVVDNLAIHEVAMALSSASTDNAEKSKCSSRITKEKKVRSSLFPLNSLYVVSSLSMSMSM